MISVAMLLMQLMSEVTIAHAKSEPWSALGWWMMGPTPLAFTMDQMKNVMPAIGTTMALAVKR